MDEKKLIELRQRLTARIEEARALSEEGKIDEAEKGVEEAENLKQQIRSLEKLLKLESEVRQGDIIKHSETPIEPEEDDNKEPKVEARSILLKALAGKQLTLEERDVLIEGTAGTGQVSAGYIVPEDVKTEINQYKRQYTSLKQYVDVQITSTDAGSFVFEKTSTLSVLADLTEGGDIAEQTPDFEKKIYAIKDKGALLPVSNQLLQDEKGNLLAYVAGWFSRKAVKTENVDIITALTGAKAKKAIADLPALAKAIIKDLDPALLDGAIVITNQDGFNFLDSVLDSTNRPLLQPDPTNATKKMYKGLPIVVMSNANLATTAGKAPILVGSFTDAIRFMDRDLYELAVSKEAGFTKNITYLRAIERYDVVVKDVDAYINGELTIT